MAPHPESVRNLARRLLRLQQLIDKGATASQPERTEWRLDVQHAGTLLGEVAGQVVFAEARGTGPGWRVEQHDVQASVPVRHSGARLAVESAHFGYLAVEGEARLDPVSPSPTHL